MKIYTIILIFFFFYACKTTPKIHQEQKPKQESVQHNDTLIYGFHFDIAKSYHKIIDDVPATDLKGNIRGRETAFKDAGSGSEIHIVYHPAPYGKSIFDYYRDLAEKQKASFTKIDDLPAVEVTENIVFNGKGLPLDSPQVRKKYYILTTDNSCLELVLNRDKDDQISAEYFQEFINKIKKQ